MDIKVLVALIAGGTSLIVTVLGQIFNLDPRDKLVENIATGCSIRNAGINGQFWFPETSG